LSPGRKSTVAPLLDDAATLSRTSRPKASIRPAPASHWSGCAIPATA
jgi:hypothetical protein